MTPRWLRIDAYSKPLGEGILHENGRRILGKIAAEVERAVSRRAVNGARAAIVGRVLARGSGWTAEDVICTAGPGDPSYEEQHAGVSIAIVVSGSFQYRSTSGRAMMTPGSLFLGSPGQCFECGHEHAAGDRCVAFRYDPEFVERIARDAGARAGGVFRVPRLPPLRETSPLVALACAGLDESAAVAWEEMAIELAARTALLADGRGIEPRQGGRDAEARVTRVVRDIERRPAAARPLADIAGEAGLSPFHCLRTFVRVTGVTPHQYVLRTRLRAAALRLAAEPARVIDVALESGFDDVSNFNHAFRVEFGVTPRAYRAGMRASPVAVSRRQGGFKRGQSS